MSFKIVYASMLYFLFVNCKHLEKRQADWFEPYTFTVLKTDIQTSYTPSSCVQVEPTLPPCRNVRYLKFPSFVTKPSPQNIERTIEGNQIFTTKLNWVEYLGIYAPTVTVTDTLFKTTTVEDPRVVVTFAVKGCRPLRLPDDLSTCEMENPSSVTVEEILPTSTVASNFVPASNYDPVANIQDIINSNNNDLDSVNFDPVQPSSDTVIFDSKVPIQPTESLPSAGN
ncbi:unnamed protein product [Brassicogethes aeneus]|uniref:Uncharacterized protein n=1 Tax=Brassicogethes aeneus TaxID=1431903 RepID=A0A9P0FA88_BRAAE|nr:unnamed protein product [Brassicogethes aeneus]